MFLSVIICTYRRAGDLERLLPCLAAQTYRDFEVLVVDGSGDDPSVTDTVARFQREHAGPIDLRLIAAPRGLTRQRNVGLRNSTGDVLCFLDDDVTFGSEFLASTVALLQQPGMDDVGGIGACDAANPPEAITGRWHLRRWLGLVPSLEPGDVDHLGRSVPLGFLGPFRGSRPVGLLNGFCMIYRRAAVGQLTFDETLPTYGGEDRDFSLEVGRHWRLILCGDLHLEHHRSPNNRVEGVRQIWESAFGIGRSFAKRMRGAPDGMLIVRHVLGELFIDALAFLRHPSPTRLSIPLARTAGIVAGLCSVPRQSLVEEKA